MVTLYKKDDLFTAGCMVANGDSESKGYLISNDLCHVSAWFFNRGMTLGYDIENVSASVVSRDFDRTVRSVT